MNIFKTVLIIVFLTFSFVGCQSNNSGVSDDIPIIEDSEFSETDVIKIDTNTTTLPQINIDATSEVDTLSIINGNDISINRSGEIKDIYIMAFNSSGSTTTEGEITFQWPVEFIEKGIDFGTILPPKAPIVDGRVHFTYTAPSDLKAREDSGYKGVNFLFHTTDRADVNITLYIDFNSSDDYSSVTPILKTLVLSESNISVQSSNQINNLSLYAYTDKSTINVNTSLFIKYPESIISNGIDIGTLPSEITIVNGKVDFNYNGPSNLLETISKLNSLGLGNSVVLNLYNHSGINTNLNLTFLTDAKYDNYKITATENSRVITMPQQPRVIDIFVETDDNKPASNETILLDYFDGSYGTMNAFSGVTDANGHIAFEYKSPSRVQSGDKYSLVFKLQSNPNKDINITFQATKNIDNLDYSNYSLTVLEPIIKEITEASQSKVIDLYLKFMDARPADGQRILLDFFDGNNGTINSFSAITDLNGHAVFEYKSPTIINNLNDFNLTFRLENNSSISKNVVIDINSNKLLKDYKGYSLISLPSASIITSPLQAKVVDIYFEDANNRPAVGESIVLDYFDGSQGTMSAFNGVTDANGHIAFEYISGKNISSGDEYNLTFSLEENSSYSTITSFTVGSGAINAKYNGYILNAIVNNNTITTGLQSKIIDVYIETDDNKPASNEVILVDYFFGNNGTMNAFSGTTDANGYLAFEYIAPLTVAQNDTYTVHLKMQNNPNKDANITFIVGTNSGGVDYSGYNLTVLEPQNKIVTDGLESKVIDIYLKDMNNRPAEGQVILLDFFDGNKGSVSSANYILLNQIQVFESGFSKTTDENGHVAFEYISPEIVTNGLLNTLKFRMENNTSIDVNTTITVNKTPLIVKDYTGYKLTSIPATSTITEDSQSKVIDIYFEDAENRPADGESIVLDYFDGSQGTMSSFSGITDSNGHLAFEYTAVTNLVDGTDYNLVFSLESNSSFSDTTTLTVDTTIAVKDYTNYTLSLLPSTFTITQSLQTHTIELYLENPQEAPAQNETIIVKYFNGVEGSINKFSGTTDAQGKIDFLYSSPENLLDMQMDSLTFRIENDISKEINATFTIDTAQAKPRIHLQNPSITLTQSDEEVKIKVLAFDENNQTLENGSIIVKYPTEIIDNNISGGHFMEREVNIINGEAIFTLIAPSPLVAIINPLEFIFVYTGNETITAPLEVIYSPKIPRIATLNDINVTINSEVLNIDISVFDADNSPYPDGSVKIIYPNEILNGRDIGSFETSTIELVDGKARFVYTAPTQLDIDTSDIVFKFYHESERSVMTELKILINPDPDQVVLTTYSIRSSLVDNELSMGLQSSRFISFSVEDTDDISVPDSNMTNIKVTLLNPALAILEDTSGRIDNSLDFYDTNNVTVNLKTDNISGVIPIKIETTFKDVNNNEQNLTKIFNILVLSGPPSAISLSYAGTLPSTEELQSRAKMAEKWVVTVTDKYSNLVNTYPAISMGVMSGYTQSSATVNNSSNYLYFKPSDGNGTLDLVDQNFTVDSQIGSNNVFDNIDDTNEYLVTFANGYRYNASGKWDINIDSSDTVDLRDTFEGNTTSNLGFAVGYNYRQDRCEEGVEWVANVYPENNNYTIDETGSVKIIVEYDYYLVGKSVMLWTNLLGIHNGQTIRIGESKKITLRGLGLGIDGKTTPVSVENGVSNKQYRIFIPIQETETFYSNSKFSYRVEVSNNLSIDAVSDSNGDLDNCKAYVDVNVSENESKTGTITITELRVENEF